MDAERADERVRVPGARCPFCHEEVPRGEEPAVCVACHALHHVGCFQEHGACSACGAAHPRFGARPAARLTERSAGVAAPWAAERQPMTLVTLVLLALAALIALGALLVKPDANDAAVGGAVLLAALLGGAATVWRGAMFGWGIASAGMAAGLATALKASVHVRRSHEGDVIAWIAVFFVIAVGLVLEDLRRPRRPTKAEKGPS